MNTNAITFSSVWWDGFFYTLHLGVAYHLAPVINEIIHKLTKVEKDRFSWESRSVTVFSVITTSRLVIFSVINTIFKKNSSLAGNIPATLSKVEWFLIISSVAFVTTAGAMRSMNEDR